MVLANVFHKYNDISCMRILKNANKKAIKLTKYQVRLKGT